MSSTIVGRWRAAIACQLYCKLQTMQEKQNWKNCNEISKLFVEWIVLHMMAYAIQLFIILASWTDEGVELFSVFFFSLPFPLCAT